MSNSKKIDRDIARFAREIANGGTQLPKFNMEHAAEVLSMAAAEDLVPMHDLILVEKLKHVAKTKSGLALPDPEMYRSQEDTGPRSTVLRGVVVAVGDGRYSPYFDWKPPMSLEVGDIIALSFHQSMPPLQWDGPDGRTYFAIREPDVQLKYRGKALLEEEIDASEKPDLIESP